MSNRRPLALVTGASSGIGRELACELAEKQYDLILVARSEGPMNELASELHHEFGVNVEVQPCDLSRPGAVQYLANRVGGRLADVELLINNAGFGINGRFDKISDRQTSDMVFLNVNALTELCREIAPLMVKRRRGQIINIASVAAFQPCPNFAVYGATKAYVLSLSEAMNMELKPLGVTVTAVCPGATDTPFHEVAGSRNALTMRLMDSASKVAHLSLQAASAGKSVIVTGVLNKGIPLAARVLPRYVVGKTAQFLFKR